MKTRYNPTDKIFTKRWGGLILLALLVLSALCCFVSGVAWLGWILSLLVLLLFGYRALQKRFKATKWWKILNSFFMVLAVFGVAIFLRLFVFEVYEIPSESMENTLVPGDKIVVNKLSIGPRMPRSPFEIPWVNLLFYTSKEARTRIDSTWWAPRRLKGFSPIRRNDVLVFQNKPVGPDFFIKRCVALPGDVFQIVNSDLFINGQYAETNYLPDVKKKWRVYCSNSSCFRSLSDSLHLVFFQDNNPEEGKRSLILSRMEAGGLKSFPGVDSLHPEVQPPDPDAWLTPYGKRAFWSPDQYGPIRIPYKGWTLKLNEETLSLYFETIRTWEGSRIETIGERFYRNGKEVTDYTFRNDYYVFMGDYRYNSVDSRMWGFLPEQEIVGKASRILWSNNVMGMKWKRILKKIK